VYNDVATPAKTKSPLRLRERLGLRGEVKPRDVSVAIARLTRMQAQQLLADVDAVEPASDQGDYDYVRHRERTLEACADQEGLPKDVLGGKHWVLAQRSGELSLAHADGDEPLLADVTPEGARRTLARIERAGELTCTRPVQAITRYWDGPCSVSPVEERILDFLRKRTERATTPTTLKALAATSTPPEQAWDELALLVGRSDLVGKFLSHHASIELALLVAPLLEDRSIYQALFSAAGLALSLSLSHDFYEHQCQVNPPWLRKRLGRVAEPTEVNLEELLRWVGEVSRNDAIEILQLLNVGPPHFNTLRLRGWRFINQAKYEGILSPTNDSSGVGERVTRTSKRSRKNLHELPATLRSTAGIL
jgi:hypothetical protein